jgi:5-formyltetrahydrofolate cyclo-ligase
MPHLDLPMSKQRLRKKFLAAREQLPPPVRAGYNVEITKRLLQLPAYHRAKVILGYMNFGSEYASEQWILQVLSSGKRLLLPKVNKDTNLLDLYWVNDPNSQLQSGLWGIREPIIERCEPLREINEVEFVLLPGVAFSPNGARLGYGGGFYDRLLEYAPLSMARVAAAFGVQIAAQIPQDRTDIKVEIIVTEQETIECKPSVSSVCCEIR